jgi:hypothetical protein
LAIFAVPASNTSAPYRGLVATAREAGAAKPSALGRQFALIFEGANALAASCDDPEVFTDAQRAAKSLLDLALSAKPTASSHGSTTRRIRRPT